ncbi:MAG: hypothetical protein NFW17_12050 [Candidatus Accumulibacter sp.]|uniref:hypothetical protein n=1 Tax=Accumulibacter sp. TaxID=2053492 RepID=UPI0025D48F1C|nr:hypothetical protein [Accumulibacter sp.]MCM8612808.1 hypothetical protein [Accumulibacter sp.]
MSILVGRREGASAVVMEGRFESLSEALKIWFQRPLTDLPEALRQRVEHEFLPFTWDLLSPGQRRNFAQQWDYKNDPATEPERQAAWDLVARRLEIEAKTKEWERACAGTATDLATKKARLTELREAIARIDLAEKRMSGKERSEKVRRGDLSDESARKDEDFEYIAYPRAMKRLRERLGATPEEVAVWVFWGETLGGLVAYTNANELDPPPRFHFIHTMGDDYVSPLMACWFRRDDIEAFEPDERYITGKALIERWGKEPDIEPKAFVQAKIEESRLLDMHPNCGGTRATWPEQEPCPPMESGLFALSQVQAIEADDFGIDASPVPDAKPADHLNHDPVLQAKANAIAQEMLKKRRRCDVTRERVAATLATEVGMKAETVTRRIRKQW